VEVAESTTVGVSSEIAVLGETFQRLLADYGQALGDAECIHRVQAGVPDHKPVEESNWAVRSRTAFFGPLVRLLVGSHVRTRLNDLARRFAQLEPTLGPEKSADRKWFAEHRALVEEMSAHLPSLRIPGLFVIAPFAITLITAIGNVPAGIWGGVILLVGAPAVIAMLGLIKAYRRKRELFLEGAMTVDREAPELQSQHTGRNIYRVEEEMFSLLGSRRRPESDVDGWTIALGTFLLAEMSFAVPILANSSSTAINMAGLIGGFTILLAAVAITHRLPKRIWR